MQTPSALVHDAANAVGIVARIDPVQDHLGHSELALYAFAAGLEIQGLGQALPFGIAGGCGLAVNPSAGIGKALRQGLRPSGGAAAGGKLAEVGDGYRT